MEKDFKKFTRRTLLTALAALACWAAAIGVIDPFFQYHRPLFGMEPLVDNERYQNPGIADHFPYDSVILGSSMTENFRAGWFDEAFGCSSVKLSYSAARTGSYAWMLQKAAKGRELSHVFLGLDSASLIVDHGTYMFPLPEYLYDNDPFNDVEYLLNMDVLKPAARLVWKNLRGTVPPMEDAYVWDAPGLYGREKVKNSVNWDLEGRSPEPADASAYLENTRENLEKDLIPYIEANPDTEFHIFYPPYSVLQWDLMRYRGELEARLNVTELSIDMLLPYENVSLYFYQNDSDTVCDLDNYKDYSHYSAEVSREIVAWMREGKGRVTEENKQAILEDLRRLIEETDCAALLADSN